MLQDARERLRAAATTLGIEPERRGWLSALARELGVSRCTSSAWWVGRRTLRRRLPGEPEPDLAAVQPRRGRPRLDPALARQAWERRADLPGGTRYAVGGRRLRAVAADLGVCPETLRRALETPRGAV